MPIRNAKGLRWPALILGVAIVIYGSAYIVSNWYDWRALTLLIDLRPGTTTSPEFRVDQKTRYLVELEVERNIPFDELNCLLGQSMPRKPCTIKSVVDIQWAVRSGSKDVASGVSRDGDGGGYGPTITKTFGRFEGLPGTPYVLEVTSLIDGSALARANPRIAVEVHPIAYKGYLVVAQLMAMAAMGFAVIGVIWLVIWAVRASVAPGKA